ncbi:MAG: LytTR family transcriptional regulator DNA-binding domain-containing protein [Parabacteroides sp.]
MNKLEEQLDPDQFFRVNRQMILNVDAIDRVIPYSKGRIKLIVHPAPKTEILVSESRNSAFRLWLNY